VLGVLHEAFGRAGLEVASAQTATEAVEPLAGRRYVAIVADSFLPNLSPLDWLAAVRGREAP
jgi:DNA-binding NtrC family response regulator